MHQEFLGFYLVGIIRIFMWEIGGFTVNTMIARHRERVELQKE